MTAQAVMFQTKAKSLLSRRPAVAGGIHVDKLLARADAPAKAAGQPSALESGCVELLNITQPKLVAEMHERLLRTGSEILFTNTSGGAPQLLDRYRMHDEAFAISYLGAEIASRIARKFARDGSRPRVIGDVRMPWHMPGHGFMTTTEVETAVASLSSAQVAGGVDAIRLQVSQHPSHMVAAFNGARAGMAEANRRVPVIVSIRHDAIGAPGERGHGNPDVVSSDVIAAATLARSIGATALSIDVFSDDDLMLRHLTDLAGIVDSPLFIAPGATEALVRRCVTDQTIGPRLAFAGVETPAHAWRLSRFTPARPDQSPPRLEIGNDSNPGAAHPRPPRIGTA
jgi:methionine synthase I (cobalamin-dependent)